MILALCFATTPAANAATVTVDFTGSGPFTEISARGTPYNPLQINASIDGIGLTGFNSGSPLPLNVSQSELGLGVVGSATGSDEARIDSGELINLYFTASYSGVRNIILNFSFTSVLGFDPNADLLTVAAIGAGPSFITSQTFKFGIGLSLDLPDIFDTEDTIRLDLISTARSGFVVESITFTIVPVPSGLLLSASSLLLLAPFALSRRRNRRKSA